LHGSLAHRGFPAGIGKIPIINPIERERIVDEKNTRGYFLLYSEAGAIFIDIKIFFEISNSLGFVTVFQ
jgi:hypothetical protein